MPTSVATSPGTRRLSDVARLVVQPDGIVSTGWPDVEVMCRRMGVPFDEWQKGIGRLALAKRKDGKLAAMIGGVGMSLPRQVGKTYLMAGLVFALCALRPGTLVIWSAHHGKTHEETFLSMQGFAERAKVKPFVDRVYTGSGDEQVRFRNDSRILFGAREHGFGRGIPGVDVLVFDEAQILSEKALDAMLATMNTSQLGLAFYTGTPPTPTDKSDSFTRMRAEARAGELKDSVWIECGADSGADLDDRTQWAKANPSFPARTPAESILRLRKRLTEDSFRREALGIWDDDSKKVTVFGGDFWENAAVPEGFSRVPVKALGLVVAPNQDAAAIVGAGVLGDVNYVKLLAFGQETDWAAAEAASLSRKHRGIPVVMDARSQAAMLRPALRRASVRVVSTSTDEYMDACSGLWSAVLSGRLRHDDSPELNDAALVARKKQLGKRWVWDAVKSGPAGSPLIAATLAAWQTTKRVSPDIF